MQSVRECEHSRTLCISTQCVLRCMPHERMTRKYWGQVERLTTAQHVEDERHSDERSHVQTSLNIGGRIGTNGVHGTFCVNELGRVAARCIALELPCVIRVPTQGFV